jgi:CO dehydrogenase maturation factor
MSYVIAVAGKGGTGKSTVSSLIIRSLLKKGKSPILAVDADPNTNLPDSIGVNVVNTIGTVLSDYMKSRIDLPQGMTKQAYLEMKLHQILKEEKNMDVLVMGCPEGSGCYCGANAILKSYFEDLKKNYEYVVVDNEAGMEHFSRKTAAEIDLLIFCTNYSMKGLKTVERLSKMVDDLKLDIKERYILINQTPENMSDDFMAEVKKTGLPYLGNLALDDLIGEYDAKGIPLTELPDDSKTANRLDDLLWRVIH